MVIARAIDDVRRHVHSARSAGHTIRAVPTMGALHAGHRSLIERAVADGGFVVVTIFVNPAQFSPAEDFSHYPRPHDADLEVCRRTGVDLVFIPDTDVMYPDNARTWVDVETLTKDLEGASRPGHFRGVTTIVLKLLNILQPDDAYFGEKDFQQQLVIRQM